MERKENRKSDPNSYKNRETAFSSPEPRTRIHEEKGHTGLEVWKEKESDSRQTDEMRPGGTEGHSRMWMSQRHDSENLGLGIWKRAYHRPCTYFQSSETGWEGTLKTPWSGHCPVKTMKANRCFQHHICSFPSCVVDAASVYLPFLTKPKRLYLWV